MNYQLLDSGDGYKLEQFGEIILIRPAVQALWKPQLPKEVWKKAHARFSREGQNQWEEFRPIPSQWQITFEGVELRLKRTDFGHLGLFPEHALLWPWMFQFPLKGAKVLNLFAYSGAATLALASQGAAVTHLDASPGMVQWARENAELNGLSGAPIRWLVDDVRKYLARAERRGETYDAVILDPPSFGRGKTGEIFKIERDLPLILQQCQKLLTNKPLFILFTCHTPGFTPLAMGQVVKEALPKGVIETGEMYIDGPYKLPSGTFAKWRP